MPGPEPDPMPRPVPTDAPAFGDPPAYAPASAPPAAPADPPPPYAAAPYQTLSPAQRDLMAAKGRRAIGFGAVWIVFGLAVTLFTLGAASDGGVYVVAWGPVAYGIYRVVSGWLTLGKSRR